MASVHSKKKILVVDDAQDTLEVLQRNLSMQGYKVYTANCVADAITLLENTPVDLVITDLKMPKVSGLDLIKHVKDNYNRTEVMMITGYATVKGAVEAVKIGAEEYLTKPFTDEELLAAVHRALDKLDLRIVGKPSETKFETGHGIIGHAESLQRVFEAITKCRETSATVMITGESGTGKELVARAIHYGSQRAAAPFVPVNCGGIPESLLESELFGYVKGAFTGAVESRAGFFQTADGGTIFLDEIGETTQLMQVKLLRVLQNKEVCMVGANHAQKVNVRIIAATNKDLYALVQKSLFREDLYYRLNVININVPPLRERNGDIIMLARHYAGKFAKEFGKEAPQFSENALKVLKNYAWPGNIRELENLIQQLVVMIDGNIIDVPNLPPHMRFSVVREYNLNRTLQEVEIDHLRNVLASVDGNKTRAAEILGIDRKTMRRKLQALGIE